MRRARRIRQEAGASLEDVTKHTSIKLSHLARFELGSTELSSPKLVELSGVLSQMTGRPVTINELLMEEEEAEVSRA